MKYIMYLIAPFVLSSCASILNKDHCTTELWSDQTRSAIIDADTIELPAHQITRISLERSRNQKYMVLSSDSARFDTVVLRPRWSTAYYFNMLSTYGIGFIIDGRKPKNWMYEPYIRLTNRWILDNSPERLLFHNRYAGKNAVNLRISLPHINQFYLSSDVNNATRAKGGFWGLSVGLDYFYKDWTFVNISGSHITNFFIPIPAAVSLNGTHDNMYSLYGSVSNNHMINKGRFSIGYGIAYGQERWNTVHNKTWGTGENMDEETDDTPNDAVVGETTSPPNVYRKSTSLGLVLPLYYYTRRSFYMGVVYRPMFVQFAKSTRFRYQHTASLDFGWRIRLSP